MKTSSPWRGGLFGRFGEAFGELKTCPCCTLTGAVLVLSMTAAMTPGDACRVDRETGDDCAMSHVDVN
jgi:hypothetical protein